MSSLRKLIHEIHRRSLWQVLAIYAVASWIIWQVIGSLYEWIGLPSWVPGAALVLLLIGLPIVLATAFVQEGGPGSDSDPAATPAVVPGLETTGETVAAAGSNEELPEAATREPKDESDARRGPTTSTRLFTWPKAITGGVLAFAALGLAAAGFMGMRALGIGPAATLISSGELDQRTEVLVADFDGPPADSLTAYALAEALRIDLSQADALTVVDPAEIGPALQRMELEPTTRLTEEVARDLAIREGIPTVLVGDLTPVGSGYQITTRLLRPDSNRVLLRVRETAEDGDDVLAAMDRLTERLLERTGESFKSIRSSGGLAEVTTSSLEALQIYTQARRKAELENDNRRAAELLEEALRIDSTFAMAWRKLGTVRGNAGDRTGAVEALTRAYELRDRLPARNRVYTEATYHTQVDYDPARVIDAYEQILEHDPDDWGAYNNIGVVYARMGDYERAVSMTDRAVAAGSTGLSLGNLGSYRLAVGDTAGAADALAARQRLYPDNSTNPALLRDILYARGDIDGVARNIERVLEQEDRTGPRQAALWDRAHLVARQGRIRDATRAFERRDMERERGGRPTGLYFGNTAFLHLLATGDTARARREFERFERNVVANLPELDRPYLPLAANRALLGDLEAARAHYETWEETIPEGVRRQSEDTRRWALGMIALAEGRTDDAIEHFEASTERSGAAYNWRYFLAWAHDLAGHNDAAIEAYHRYLDTPHGNRLWTEGYLLGPTYERLGALYEDRGDTARAAEYYSRFIDLWEDADPELQPRVDAARRALARLAAEGGG